MPSEACVMQPARGGHSLNAPGSTDTKSPSSIHVLGWLLKTWTMEWTAKDMLLSDRCTSPIFSQMRSRTSYSLRGVLMSSVVTPLRGLLPDRQV